MIDQFEKKLKVKDHSYDGRLIGLKTSYECELELSEGKQTNKTMQYKKEIDDYVNSHPSEWDMFINDQCRKAVMAAELKTRMTQAIIDAGFLPPNALTGVCRTYLITIVPLPNIDWDKFYYQSQKYIKRKFFIKYYAKYTQSGNSIKTIGNNPILQILCECKNHKPKTIQDTMSTFRGMISDLDVKLLKTVQEWDDNLRNLIEKTNVIDKMWRESIDLPDSYSENMTICQDQLQITEI